MARTDVTPVVQIQVDGLVTEEVKIVWDFTDPANVKLIKITMAEVDSGDNVIRRSSILVLPIDLPPGILIATNQLIDHMIDQYVSQKGFTEV